MANSLRLLVASTERFRLHPLGMAAREAFRSGERCLVEVDRLPEEILALHAPHQRKRFGVYTTPAPVVQFLVRSVHELLESRLGRRGGLADPSVQVLDPAAGSANFLIEAVRVAVAQVRRAAGDAAIPPLVREHLEPHFIGFEVLRLSHACGQLALQTLYEQHVGRLRAGARGRLLLVDALGDLEAGPPGVGRLSVLRVRDGQAARRIREEAPVTVVLGNPPFSGSSGNGGRWIQALLRGYDVGDRVDEGYFRLDGLDLGEKNRKWLQADAVRFLRLAQWMIDRNGEGIVALVLPHSFVDALTYRGLRRSLLRTFEEILVVDLHGNLRKRETTPQGGVDENVFPGVRQGAAMLFLVKKPGLPPRVMRADLFGGRREKLEALARATLRSLTWEPIEPAAPAYLFVRTSVQAEREYRLAPGLRDIFPIFGTGLVTGRDGVLVDASRRALAERLRKLRRSLRRGEPLPKAWQFEPERLHSFLADRQWAVHIRRVLVRPCEVRFVFVAPYFCARPRRAVMAHLGGADNVALLATRQTRDLAGAFVTSRLVGHKVLSGYDVNSVFPLYLRSEGAYAPNLSPAILERLGTLLGASPPPGEILGYIYGLLYSRPYRQRFRELLLRDFPRIPLPDCRESWSALSRFGSELVSIHQTLSEGAAAPISPGSMTFDEQADPELLLREELASAGVEPEVWSYRIGSYQVLARWLARRRGQGLSYGAVSELFRIVATLRRTVAIERQLEEVSREVLGRTPRANRKEPR